MIVTVTLNPAVDRVVVLDELRLGDTNRVYDGEIDPGGKGVNVSRVLRELGGDSIAMGLVAGSLGRFIEASLEKAGIAHAFLHTPGQTRQNLVIVETRFQRHTLLNEAGPETDPLYVRRLERQLARRVKAGDWVVLAGSVPPRIPPSVYADLTELVHAAEGRVCLDADGEPLAQGIRACPDLIKPNREELERLVGRPLPDQAHVVQAAMDLHDRGIAYVVVSMGRRGTIALGPEGAWRALPPLIETVSAVGSGDSLVAGVVLALSRGESLVEGLRLGTAAGAATAMRPGTRLARAEDIVRLLPRVVVEPLYLRKAA
jgi:1-phosphofructokinase